MRMHGLYWNPNPEAHGGFQLPHRRRDIYLLNPDRLLCTAICKRTGLPCRNIAVAGPAASGKCRQHGGGNRGSPSGRGKIALAKSWRQNVSKTAVLLRKAARTAIADMQLDPETLRLFASNYAQQVYPPSTEEFLLTLNQKVVGEVTMSEVKTALEVARRYRRDPDAPERQSKPRMKKMSTASRPLVRDLAGVLREDLRALLKSPKPE